MQKCQICIDRSDPELLFCLARRKVAAQTGEAVILKVAKAQEGSLIIFHEAL
jgi:hypothetical protein